VIVSRTSENLNNSDLARSGLRDHELDVPWEHIVAEPSCPDLQLAAPDRYNGSDVARATARVAAKNIVRVAFTRSWRAA
jgi:hypothetical protein